MNGRRPGSPLRVAVVAHSGKSLGGGLLELRRVLEDEGVREPFWAEVAKSRKAPAQVARALEEGAELVFVWGGDGMVQRSVEVLAGSSASLAIIPAGTANLLAHNLGIPTEIAGAVALGLRGERRRLDVGRLNGECFVVMAGVGFDAAMIRDARGLKERLGRVAYLWSGSRQIGLKPFKARIRVDGVSWYRGPATLILLGNVGDLFAGIEVFEQARPDDGVLELGVVTAEGAFEWGRTILRTALGSTESSPFVRTTSARAVEVTLGRKLRYELDGGARGKLKSFRITVDPAAVSICAPPAAPHAARAAAEGGHADVDARESGAPGSSARAQAEPATR